MMVVEEKEKKYLIHSFEKKDIWNREHIVYQWFINKSESGSEKVKIIFDLTRLKLIYVRVKKQMIELGNNKKTVEYLDVNQFDPEQMIGIPFVLKRRAIKDDVFLDKFIVSNGITEYLVEYEGKESVRDVCKEISVQKEVTDDINYYNQSMCVPFSKEDAKQLKFLMKIFKI